jgi:CBS domain-containing protein
VTTTFVYEVMNPELYAISPERPARTVIDDLLERRITSAPVVDRAGYPVGVLSLHDLLHCHDDRQTAGQRMSAPAVVIEAGVTVEAAARLLSAANLHRLVVVDELGRAIGIVSALDIIRGLTGQPATHPWPFPFRHRDSVSAWCQAMPLDAEHVEATAPACPGVFIVLKRVEGRPDSVVWAESTHDVRARMRQLLGGIQSEPLTKVLQKGGLSFRCVDTPYRAAREAALHARTA